MKIKPETIIGEVINKYPKSIDIFLKFGFFCFGCPRAQMETIEEGAKAHEFNKEQIKKMISELNKLVKTKTK